MSLRADVLVVNDHLLDAEATLVAFEQVAPRARVLHLSDGGEALEYLFSTGLFAGRTPIQPSLVLLSLEMQTITGLCVLDLMRAHPLTKDIPVVLVSLEGNPRVYRRHDRFDANAYLTMPCDFHRYCAVIEGCVSRWLPWALRRTGARDGVTGLKYSSISQTQQSNVAVSANPINKATSHGASRLRRCSGPQSGAGRKRAPLSKSFVGVVPSPASPLD